VTHKTAAPFSCVADLLQAKLKLVQELTASITRREQVSGSLRLFGHRLFYKILILLE
jgi:hypothetical protein